MIKVDDKFAFVIEPNGLVTFYRHGSLFLRPHGNLEHSMAQRIAELEAQVLKRPTRGEVISALDIMTEPGERTLGDIADKVMDLWR